MNATERGAVLLEVLLALAVLGVAGSAALTLAVESGNAIRQVALADHELARASAFLDVVVLWPREELDQRLGERQQGQWRLTIQRPAATLYVVTLTDTTGRRGILRTAVHRPETTDALP